MTDTTTTLKTGVQTHSLAGEWQLSQAGDDEWMTGTVPGDIHTDLLDNDVIDHPHNADNEIDVQWVAKTDWTYKRTFEVDDATLDQDRVVLECLGLDTVAEVSINGTVVGETRNMHREYDFEVGDALESGTNEITVAFENAVDYAARRKEELPYEVPLLRYSIDHPGRNLIRKAQCHFGWDWGPCLAGVGIWRDIRLVSYSSPRITHSTTDQTHHEDGDVTLAVRVGIDAPGAGEAKLTASVAGVSTTETVELADGDNEVELDLRVPDPDRWWPRGYGDQPLYDLDLRVERDEQAMTTTDRIGFREIELVTEEEAESGLSFQFVVNGEPIYAKGANWIPVESMRGAIESERYEQLLSGAVDANMNMIRVWGGGYYELDEFYERCDELGLLVWQDFMFACSLYPADEQFLDNVEAEARDQVRRLANHPSIALWCGNNENEVGITAWFEEADHHDQLLEDYRELTARLDNVVAQEDPSRTFWQSSPSSNTDPLDPEDESRGDLHYWGVWHEGEPFSDYETVEPRFVSEFGYQSFSSVDQLSGVIPEDHLNPTAPLMEHHQRSGNGNALILERMTDNFRVPFDFENFVYLSQVQHGLAMKTAIEHWRRLKPYCNGTLFWQLNDLWPCASWSSIEYGDRWKALQFMARRFYAPVLVSGDVDDDGEQLDVWLTSDLTEPDSGTVTVEAVALDGESIATETVEAELDAHESTTVATLSVKDLIGDVDPDSVMIRLDYDSDAESYPNTVFLEPYKRLTLSDPDLDVTIEDGTATVEASSAALFVSLTAQSLPGRFEDNYFHLAPGEQRTVEYTDDDVTDATLSEELTVTHLKNTY
jgi:beta-mannosidase